MAMADEVDSLVVKKKQQLLEELEALIMAATPQQVLEVEGIAATDSRTRPEGQDGKNLCKIIYSREKMEDLKFLDIEQQRKLWSHVYTGLGPLVRSEYDQLPSSKHQKSKNKHSPAFPTNHWEACAKVMEVADMVKSETDHGSPNASCSCNVGDEDNYQVLEEHCSEDDDSDEDYASIQRPAFVVEGEPNFDSGPPEDGLEYLRRVRWEAAQIPKVRVVKLDRSKLNKEQSDYMPKIPDIAKCPEHLLPLKQWEDSFLAEFSQLRLALSDEISSAKYSGDVQSEIILPEKRYSYQVSEKGKTKDHSDESDDCSSYENADDSLSTDEDTSTNKLIPKSSVIVNCGNYPLLSVISKMDSVARVSMLKKRISSFGDMNINSSLRDDCLWLFSLCAVVDTPLDADTCASLRSLLRKSAALLSAKSDIDDEVVMLNILATISGQYFGQFGS